MTNCDNCGSLLDDEDATVNRGGTFCCGYCASRGEARASQPELELAGDLEGSARTGGFVPDVTAFCHP